MSVFSLASSNLTIKREGSSVTTSDIVLDGTEQAISYVPSVASFIKAKISGVTSDGIIRVKGDSGAGVAQEEDLATDRNGWLIGDKTFGTITSITGLTGAIGVTVDLRVSGSDGSAVLGFDSIVVANTRGAISYRGEQEVNTVKLGVRSDAGCMIAIQYTTDFAPMVGDFITDDDTGEEWLVVGIKTYRGGRRFHHWEIACVKREHGDPQNQE
jgi:hypothetical protein